MKRELESRTTSHGGEVRLIWDDVSGRLDLEVVGPDGELQACEISAESALDALEHPSLYLAVGTPSHH
jgi:hypothetical protein